ncbi:hypothetical protein NIES4072_25470 [Nostoc commune NIES-4072]|uniref:Uncharacterized protein n=1 Tax=Nostoc commune NIES-4072 TaxID=2005467 RepID=A0A2R5FJE0_NOSCO|nr:hypothetical protein NIES4070_01390 [Nostoc commune HK-02]GBG18882.1 hypothetical protein NIES4072_25470 [Nostoc commune NIES-4072]
MSAIEFKTSLFVGGMLIKTKKNYGQLLVSLLPSAFIFIFIYLYIVLLTQQRLYYLIVAISGFIAFNYSAM